jgi:hypothetical protein
MGLQPLLDEHFPTHGDWVGLSLGWVTVVWLIYTLSQADHRLNHVEPWVAAQLHTLHGGTGQRVHPLWSKNSCGCALVVFQEPAKPIEPLPLLLWLDAGQSSTWPFP